MITPQEAWSRLSPLLVPLPPEDCPRRQARGRVLAHDLAATVDVPPADVSAMDGYALEGAFEAGAERTVAGVIAAGDAPGFELPPGQAVRIMTGAPVPTGADRVVPVEATDRGRERVRFERPSTDRDHIRRQGEVLRSGAPLLATGTPLSSSALSLIATHGYQTVPTVRPPRVRVLATGDEIVPPEALPQPGQLRDSHTDFLLAAGAARGLTFEALGIARDDPRDLRAKIAHGLEADVLLVCGGVSAGEFDYAEGIFAELGCEALFDAVAMQPGKPLVAGRHPGGLVFGLPGNPASVMVSYRLFVQPTLDRLAGRPAELLGDARQGTLLTPAPAAKGRDRFLPARVAWQNGVARVEPLVAKGSHDLAAFGLANALLHRPADSPAVEVGSTVSFLDLD
ncbi:MAG: gephyrin-like molybdotransferase Glp [Acidobacteriota bacterium]